MAQPPPTHKKQQGKLENNQIVIDYCNLNHHDALCWSASSYLFHIISILN